MNRTTEFTSEPFDFDRGGILSVEAKAARAGALGLVEFRLEGSEDKILWADLLTGSVSDGQRVEVSSRDRVAPWGRLRLRGGGGTVDVGVHRFPRGDG